MDSHGTWKYSSNIYVKCLFIACCTATSYVWELNVQFFGVWIFEIKFSRLQSIWNISQNDKMVTKYGLAQWWTFKSHFYALQKSDLYFIFHKRTRVISTETIERSLISTQPEPIQMRTMRCMNSRSTHKHRYTKHICKTQRVQIKLNWRINLKK